MDKFYDDIGVGTSSIDSDYESGNNLEYNPDGFMVASENEPYGKEDK